MNIILRKRTERNWYKRINWERLEEAISSTICFKKMTAGWNSDRKASAISLILERWMRRFENHQQQILIASETRKFFRQELALPQIIADQIGSAAAKEDSLSRLIHLANEDLMTEGSKAILNKPQISLTIDERKHLTNELFRKSHDANIDASFGIAIVLISADKLLVVQRKEHPEYKLNAFSDLPGTHAFKSLCFEKYDDDSFNNIVKYILYHKLGMTFEIEVIGKSKLIDKSININTCGCCSCEQTIFVFLRQLSPIVLKTASQYYENFVFLEQGKLNEILAKAPNLLTFTQHLAEFESMLNLSGTNTATAQINRRHARAKANQEKLSNSASF